MRGCDSQKDIQVSLQHGVLILNAGTYDNVIRLLMRLNITDEAFSDALQVMEEGLSVVAAELGELAGVVGIDFCKSHVHSFAGPASLRRGRLKVAQHAVLGRQKRTSSPAGQPRGV